MHKQIQDKEAAANAALEEAKKWFDKASLNSTTGGNLGEVQNLNLKPESLSEKPAFDWPSEQDMLTLRGMQGAKIQSIHT